MKNDERKIETHGNQSPGYVGGDYVIHQTTVNQSTELTKKKWRELDQLRFPPMTDVNQQEEQFVKMLVVHLHRVFKDSGYVQFVGLVNVQRIMVPDASEEPIPFCCLWCHQVNLTGAVRKSMSNIFKPEVDIDSRQNYIDELNLELSALQNNWALNFQAPMLDEMTPWQFTYDPDALRITIEPAPIISINFGDYPNQVRTTSELLTWLSVFFQVNGIVTDIAIVESHYPLFKLVTELMDNRPSFDVSKFRTNIQNLEEWDYINPAADIEVKRYLKNNEYKGYCHAGLKRRFRVSGSSDVVDPYAIEATDNRVATPIFAGRIGDSCLAYLRAWRP